MPKDWNAFWYWRDRPVQERVNAATVLGAAGVQIVDLISRSEDPPDCEAKLDERSSGIEVTELLHQPTAQQSIKAKRERAAGKEPKRPGAFRLGSRQPAIRIRESH
jgi:hypothetical protein